MLKKLLGTKYGLLHHIKCNGIIDNIKFFIENGDNVNDKYVSTTCSGPNSESILMLTVSQFRGDIEKSICIINLLIDNGADVNYVNEQDNSLMRIIIKFKYSLYKNSIIVGKIISRLNTSEYKKIPLYIITDCMYRIYVSKIIYTCINKLLPEVECKICSYLI